MQVFEKGLARSRGPGEMAVRWPRLTLACDYVIEVISIERRPRESVLNMVSPVTQNRTGVASLQHTVLFRLSAELQHLELQRRAPPSSPTLMVSLAHQTL